MSTPAPKPMIRPIKRVEMRTRRARIAPITSEEPARAPQPKAAAICAQRCSEAGAGLTD
jgi:hypothetical protein